MNTRRQILASLAMLSGFAIAKAGPAIGSGTAPLGSLLGFTDDRGRIVTVNDPPDAMKLMIFGYTTCPDVCPLTLLSVHQALDRLAQRNIRISVAFVTVDPDRDTVQRLHDYVNSFDERIRGYRGDDQLLDALTKPMKVRFWREALQPDSPDYTMSHTSALFILSREGRVLGRVEHSPDQARLSADIVRAVTAAHRRLAL